MNGLLDCWPGRKVGMTVALSGKKNGTTMCVVALDDGDKAIVR